MPDQDWTQEALFDHPQVRHQPDDVIRIEQPPAVDPARIASPPVPDAGLDKLRAVLNDPTAATALWQDPDEPTDAEAATGLGMALYFLHALHAPPRTGHEPAPRPTPRRDRDDGLEPLPG